MLSNSNYDKFTYLISDKKTFKNIFKNIFKRLESFPGNVIGSKHKDSIINITNYFELKNILIEFRKIKECLITVIELSKIDFQKIKFSRKSYNLYKEKILISNFSGNSENDLKNIIQNKQFKSNFLTEFIDNDCILYRDFETIDFLNIFQNEYFEKSKNYFINLINKYIDVRNKIKNILRNDDNRMIYTDLYEYNDDSNIDFTKSINKDKTENYVLYGNNISFNNFNNNKNKKNKLSEKNKMLEKRDIYEKLYKNKKTKEIYITDFKKRYTEYHNNLYKNLNNILNGPANLDLYSYLINSINVDYNLINFILYFEENIDEFEKKIKNYLEIQKDILMLTNNFEKFYHPYLDWYKSFMNPQKPTVYDKDEIETIGNFSDYYNIEIDSLLKT